MCMLYKCPLMLHYPKKYNLFYKSNILRNILCSMVQLLLRICGQRLFISLLVLPPTKSTLISWYTKDICYTQNRYLLRSSVCSIFLNQPTSYSYKKYSKNKNMERRSSSPEILEVIQPKESPRQESSTTRNDEKNLSSHKRKRKTVAETLKQNFRKWEESNLDGQKKGNTNSVSTEIVNLETSESSSTNSDDIGIIEVIPKSCKTVCDAKALYSADSPLSKRQWRNTNVGSKAQREGLRSNQFPFSVMSYNVLSQDLLEQHTYLYTNHDPKALNWSLRHSKFMEEIRMHLPDVLCLQEVQASHLQEFFKIPLSKIGYEGIYKQRTGDKVDGCAIFWQRGKFVLVEETSVEFYQPGIHLLNRDNVAVVVRLAVQGSNDQIVVATTHLLYNPRRYDVRLAQTQLLLAELDRISHTGSGSSIIPVILTGDFNLNPHSCVYSLLTTGKFYQPEEDFVSLPPYLGITDCCRHFSLILHRESLPYTTRTPEIVTTELKMLQLFHSERNAEKIKPLGVERVQSEQKFGTGVLLHGLRLQSAYEHPRNIKRHDQEATTFQDDWVTVDYIFYSNNGENFLDRRRLSLLARWSLPTVAECGVMGPIPNLDAPSDHLPLVACFLLS